MVNVKQFEHAHEKPQPLALPCHTSVLTRRPFTGLGGLAAGGGREVRAGGGLEMQARGGTGRKLHAGGQAQAGRERTEAKDGT